MTHGHVDKGPGWPMMASRPDSEDETEDFVDQQPDQADAALNFGLMEACKGPGMATDPDGSLLLAPRRPAGAEIRPAPNSAGPEPASSSMAVDVPPARIGMAFEDEAAQDFPAPRLDGANEAVRPRAKMELRSAYQDDQAVPDVPVLRPASPPALIDNPPLGQPSRRQAPSAPEIPFVDGGASHPTLERPDDQEPARRHDSLFRRIAEPVATIDLGTDYASDDDFLDDDPAAPDDVFMGWEDDGDLATDRAFEKPLEIIPHRRSAAAPVEPAQSPAGHVVSRINEAITALTVRLGSRYQDLDLPRVFGAAWRNLLHLLQERWRAWRLDQRVDALALACRRRLRHLRARFLSADQADDGARPSDRAGAAAFGAAAARLTTGLFIVARKARALPLVDMARTRLARLVSAKDDLPRLEDISLAAIAAGLGRALTGLRPVISLNQGVLGAVLLSSCMGLLLIGVLWGPVPTIDALQQLQAVPGPGGETRNVAVDLLEPEAGEASLPQPQASTPAGEPLSQQNEEFKPQPAPLTAFPGVEPAPPVASAPATTIDQPVPPTVPVPAGYPAATIAGAPAATGGTANAADPVPVQALQPQSSEPAAPAPAQLVPSANVAVSTAAPTAVALQPTVPVATLQGAPGQPDATPPGALAPAPTVLPLSNQAAAPPVADPSSSASVAPTAGAAAVLSIEPLSSSAPPAQAVPTPVRKPDASAPVSLFPPNCPAFGDNRAAACW